MPGVASAAVPSYLAGTVTDEQGKPLSGICAVVENSLGHGFDLTDSQGRWRVDAPVGYYRVAFVDCVPRSIPYAREWYDDSPTEAGAPYLIVPPGGLERIDARLTHVGLFGGQVRDQFGEPVEGLCVTTMAGPATRITTTDAAGRWRLIGEDEVEHQIRFGGCAGTPDLVVTEWYRDAATREEATAVSTYRGNIVTVDATVERTGAITGALRDASGDPVGSVCIQARRDGQVVAEIASDGDGRYLLGGLDTGSYQVALVDCHLAGWVNTTWGDGASVEVTRGRLTSGIDLVVQRTGTVSGRVTDSAGDPLTVCVSAWHPDEGVWAYLSGITDAQGRYTLERIQPNVKIAFMDCLTDFIYEWYDDAPTRATATTVHVPPATEVVGIDAVVVRGGEPLVCEGRTSDLDNDRLTDCEEVLIYGTSMFQPDTDDDLFGDGYEVHGGRCQGTPYSFEGGSDPNDSASTPVADLPVGLPRRSHPGEYYAVVCR